MSTPTTPPPAMGAEAKMREAFEAWVRNELGDDPKYWQHATEWAAWQEATRQAMERCAALCDAKYLVRHAQGFPREASTARNLRDAIRALTNESEKRHG